MLPSPVEGAIGTGARLDPPVDLDVSALGFDPFDAAAVDRGRSTEALYVKAGDYPCFLGKTGAASGCPNPNHTCARANPTLLVLRNGSVLVGKRNPNPNEDLQSFDDFPLAFLTVLTCMSLEGWVDVMYHISAAWAGGGWCIIYFLLLVVFGSFFIINLVIAIIYDNYHVMKDMAEGVAPPGGADANKKQNANAPDKAKAGGADGGGPPEVEMYETRLKDSVRRHISRVHLQWFSQRALKHHEEEATEAAERERRRRQQQQQQQQGLELQPLGTDGDGIEESKRGGDMVIEMSPLANRIGAADGKRADGGGGGGGGGGQSKGDGGPPALSGVGEHAMYGDQAGLDADGHYERAGIFVDTLGGDGDGGGGANGGGGGGAAAARLANPRSKATMLVRKLSSTRMDYGGGEGAEGAEGGEASDFFDPAVSISGRSYDDSSTATGGSSYGAGGVLPQQTCCERVVCCGRPTPCLRRLCVKWRRFQRRLQRVVDGKVFNTIVMTLIIGNTVVLCCEHHPMPHVAPGNPLALGPRTLLIEEENRASFDCVLESVNTGFTFAFIMEAVLKLLALGPRGYVKDSFNIFDGTIVLISIVELAAAPPSCWGTSPAAAAAAGVGEVNVTLGHPDAPLNATMRVIHGAGDGGGGSGGAFTIFRSFRLLRVFKLARSWTALQQLLSTIMLSLSGLVYFAILLLIFVYIFSLIGMDLFGGKYETQGGFDEAPRANFNSFWWSMVTVFQVMTGENWNDVLYDCMRVDRWLGGMYMVTLFVLGNYLVINLFLAILLENFAGGTVDIDDDDDDDDDDDSDDDDLSDGSDKDELDALAAEVEALGEGSEASADLKKRIAKRRRLARRKKRRKKQQKEKGKKKEKQKRKKAKAGAATVIDDVWGSTDSPRTSVAPLPMTQVARAKSLHGGDGAGGTGGTGGHGAHDCDQVNSLARHRMRQQEQRRQEAEQESKGAGKAKRPNKLLIPALSGRDSDLSDGSDDGGGGGGGGGGASRGGIIDSGGSSGRSRGDLGDGFQSGTAGLEARFRVARHGSTGWQVPRGASPRIVSSLMPGQVNPSPMNGGGGSGGGGVRRSSAVGVGASPLSIDVNDGDRRASSSSQHNSSSSSKKKKKKKAGGGGGEETGGFVDLVGITAQMVDVWQADEFIGSEALDWMLEEGLVRTRRAAVCLVIGLLTVWKEGHKYGLVPVLPEGWQDSEEEQRVAQGLPPMGQVAEEAGGENNPIFRKPFKPLPVLFHDDHQTKYRLRLRRMQMLRHQTELVSAERRLKERTAAQADPLEMGNDVALACLTQSNPFRRGVQRVVIHKAFDISVYVLITVSCVVLAIDTPYHAQFPVFKDVLTYIDWAITTFFLIESILKSVAYGFICGEEAYLRDGFNQLDFAIVLISVSNLILSATMDVTTLQGLKAVRALRALKPLRVVSRNEGMKMVISSMIKAMPAIGNVCIVAVLFFVIFGCLGIQFFRGKMHYCEGFDGDQYLYDRVNCTGNYTTFGADGHLVYHERVWRSASVGTFDNIGEAMFCLFEMATLEMWPDFMYNSVDATAVDARWVRDNAMGFAGYFVVYVLVGAFFVVNLFVGVVIDTFSNISAANEGRVLMTEGQQRYVDQMKILLKSRPPESSLVPERALMMLWGERGVCLKKIARFTLSHFFEEFILGVIIVNVFTMTL